METELMIVDGDRLTLDDMCRLNDIGFTFVIEDGHVTHVVIKNN